MDLSSSSNKNVIFLQVGLFFVNLFLYHIITEREFCNTPTFASITFFLVIFLPLWKRRLCPPPPPSLPLSFFYFF